MTERHIEARLKTMSDIKKGKATFIYIKEMNKRIYNIKVQIFEMIRREFKALECADELNTSQGKHELWTPADVALSNAYNEALKKVEKEFTPKEALK